MKSKRIIERSAALAGILSNTMRLAIVERLARGPCIVGDLVDALGESQATVSKQLGLLREAGLLRCRPDGRCREYALASPDAASTLLEALHALAAEAASKSAECRARRAARAPE